ncbi:hypothetical protein FB384_001510 [Prauserella sediminis]|uniref:HNH endonuclease n=1 Tax=Prauserella sediminis TaxID=577680 RepID=A0A839XRL3_9PSEU|nr:hypothetical protein [Prauserella sediminis]MBB3662606.1 hypothetical protein [Prauserella sediminis]
MEQPAWDDPELKAGTMVRGALWLLQVVGEGNTFTKNQLRDAFPGVSQVDRRIRDLRDYGWVVYSSVEDASLLAEDQRFVRAGAAVWDPKERRKAKQGTVSSRDRQATLARDGYMCTLCGIAGGEEYPDDAVMTAVLAVSRRTVLGADGHATNALVTECKRCKAGRDDEPANVTDAIAAAKRLGDSDRRRLTRWVERGRRGSTELDRAWTAYLRVPPEQRSEVADRLKEID